MKLFLIIETVADQIEKIASRDEVPADAVSVMARQVSDKYWKWVVRSWSNGVISLPDDAFRVKEVLDKFGEVFSRLPSGQRDINFYKSLAQLESVVDPLFGVESSKKSHDLSLPGVSVVDVSGPYTTVVVDDAKSLAKLGEGTDWCTRASHPNCRASDYIETFGYVYILFQHNRPVMQYTPDYKEVADVKNDPVVNSKALSYVVAPDLEKMSKDKYRHLIASGVAEVAEVALGYAVNVLHKRWPEGEKYILSDLLKPEVRKNANYIAYIYALSVIKGRWPEAEPFIMKDPNVAVGYALNVIKGRWPETEPYIMKTPDKSYIYADKVIKGRWPEAEPYIMKDPAVAAAYAINVIEGRWPEAEPYIMKDAVGAAAYAVNVIEGRWPEAEPVILSNWDAKHEYLSFIDNYPV